MAMRTASIWVIIFGMVVSSAKSQEGNTSDDVRRGHDLADMICAICHIATPDQLYKPLLKPPAPPFESIAQRKDINTVSLQNFLTTTHGGLVTPKGMPNPDLTDFQVKQVVAYLLSLRK